MACLKPAIQLDVQRVSSGHLHLVWPRAGDSLQVSADIDALVRASIKVRRWSNRFSHQVPKQSPGGRTGLPAV